MDSGDEMREDVCFAAPLQKSTFFLTALLSKLFSFRIIPGACFSKVPIINGPGKLSPFSLKIEVSIVLHLT